MTLRTAALLITAIIFKTQSSDWETGTIRREQVLQLALAMPGFRTHHYHSLNKHRNVQSSEQLRQRHHIKSFIIGFERKKRDTYTLKLQKHREKEILLLVVALFLALNKVINTAFNRTNRRQGVPFSLCNSFSFQNTLSTRLWFIASWIQSAGPFWRTMNRWGLNFSI